MPTSFEALHLPAPLLNTLEKEQLTTPTEIQCLTLPEILKGHDIIAKASTGSGKTAAFALGTLAHITPNHYALQALIIAPTRELADQITEQFRRFAKGIGNLKILNLSGGLPFKPQADSLRQPPHIAIGTPIRLLKHLKKETLNPESLKILILDEADRMLEMGFLEQIDEILPYLPTTRQNLLFSATFQEDLQHFTQRALNSPKQLEAKAIEHTPDIEEIHYTLPPSSKPKLLQTLLNTPKATLIFANTKQQCEHIADDLYEQGYHAITLHGDKDRLERSEALLQFQHQSTLTLIATDVAARGLDIPHLERVINYDMARDQALYTHRIGRTGRAGKAGVAISFMTEYEASSLPYTPTPIPPLTSNTPSNPPYATLKIDGGKRRKLRKGDILGALTAQGGIRGEHVGSITIEERFSYVAIHYAHLNTALKHLLKTPIKGQKYRIWAL